MTRVSGAAPTTSDIQSGAGRGQRHSRAQPSRSRTRRRRPRLPRRAVRCLYPRREREASQSPTRSKPRQQTPDKKPWNTANKSRKQPHEAQSRPPRRRTAAQRGALLISPGKGTRRDTTRIAVAFLVWGRDATAALTPPAGIAASVFRAELLLLGSLGAMERLLQACRSAQAYERGSSRPAALPTAKCASIWSLRTGFRAPWPANAERGDADPLAEGSSGSLRPNAQFDVVVLGGQRGCWCGLPVPVRELWEPAGEPSSGRRGELVGWELARGCALGCGDPR